MSDSSDVPHGLTLPLAHPRSPGENDDASIHHRSISDDVLSPTSAGAPAAPSSTTKSTASSFAAAATKKLAFGGRILMSPLTAAASGITGTSSKPSAPPPVAADRSRTESTSSLVDGVTDAASAVSGYLFPGPSTGSPTSPSTLPLDPLELERQEAEYRHVTAQQRMQILEDLVQHRRADWNYIKSMHENTHYWLNIALLREQQVLEHVGDRSIIRRSVQWFYLGLGLGHLIHNIKHLAMEACQLLEELEFYFSSGTVQGMKLMVATNTTLYEPLNINTIIEEGLENLQEPFRPVIYKWNQRPVFRRLLTPSLLFPLDYREVMLSLCDILALVYSKFVEDTINSENLYIFQAIIRFDDKIKKMVIDPVKKEFSAVALTVMSEELASVRKTFSSSTNNKTNTSPTK